MNENMPTVEEMRAAFGITEDDGAEDTPTPDDNNEPDTSSGDDSNEPSPDDTSGTGEEDNEDEPQPDGGEEGTDQQDLGQNQQNQEYITKQNQAFARMRTEMSQMQKTLTMMAQVLGVNPNQPIEALSEQLQNQARGAIAKANNMDPQILQRLDYLEGINEQYNRQTLENKMKESLTNISSKYGATDEDLGVFVQDLMQSGFDPTTVDGNLENEFIRRNFDKIKQRAVDEAIRAEQERSVKGSGASQPAAKAGQENKTETQQIKSVSDLDAFLGSLTE